MGGRVDLRAVLMGLAASLVLAQVRHLGATPLTTDAAAERLVQYSPLEPAGSRGTMGYSLGFSGWQSDEIRFFRAQVVKGLPYSIDLGAAYGFLPSGTLHHGGAHVQWTPMESLSWPAVSLRGRYHVLRGGSVVARGQGVDVLLGYGFWRYIRLYGGIGVTEVRTAILDDAGAREEFGLQAPTDSVPPALETRRTDPVRFGGIQIKPWGAFVTTSVELLMSGADLSRTTWAARLAWGL